MYSKQHQQLLSKYKQENKSTKQEDKFAEVDSKSVLELSTILLGRLI